MSYTVLRVAPEGVVLLEQHERRFAVAGPLAVTRFRELVGRAAPGVWSVELREEALHAERRPGSRLTEDMPARLRTSPVAAMYGSHPKRPSPGPYDSVRAPGIATLLTSADGSEVLEACSAAVIAYEDGALFVPPRDRPRVASTAEAALLAAGVRERPVLCARMPAIALVNAVVGCCRVRAQGCPPFPEGAARWIVAVLARTTAHPRLPRARDFTENSP